MPALDPVVRCNENLMIHSQDLQDLQKPLTCQNQEICDHHLIASPLERGERQEDFKHQEPHWDDR